MKEVLNVLKRGEENRHYAQTVMNHNSSRSHSIFRLHIKSVTNPMIRSQLKGQIDQSSQGLDSIISIVTESELNFIDLAGSEKVSIH